MRYIGTYTQREQAQRKAALTQITKSAAKIRSSGKVTLIQELCSQLQHIDSGRASQAEQLKNDIILWVHATSDIKELELMKGLVIEVATMKARKAQRAARWAKREQELLQSTAQAAI